jgi:glycolate oxidase FAD binding subunit
MTIKSEDDLSAAIRDASAPLRIQGGGTRTLGATGKSLDMSGLSGITLYEPGALTLVAMAGTPVTEIEAALAAEGQRLAFEPYLLTRGASTIGGVVATNASGPRRIQAGAARDFLLGVRFVDGMGRTIKNGGRVMKNVTGYDLVKLMAGSRGQLGALSEVSLKVLPAPETEATLVLKDQDEVQAVTVMSEALGSPYDVSGAAYGPITDGKGPVFIRIEGFEASVSYRAKRLRAMMQGAVETQDPAQSRETWTRIRDVTAFAEHPYLSRLSIKPSALPEFLFEMNNIFVDHAAGQAPFEVSVDWGGGLVWVACDDAAAARNARVDPDPEVDQTLRGYQVLHDVLQSHCAFCGGHATLMRAPEGLLGRVSICQPETAGIAALTKALRAQFDPRGIFDPMAELAHAAG